MKNIDDHIDRNFIFHLLADYYVGENSGNTPMRSLLSFKDTLEHIQNSECKSFISDIFDITQKICETFDDYQRILFKFQSAHTYKYSHEWNNPEIKEEITKYLRLEDIHMEKIYNEFNVVERLSAIFYDDFFTNRDHILLLSGYTNESGGHFISLYFNKIKADQYEFIIVNSGAGLENHGSKNHISNKKICILKNNINEKQVKFILFHHMLHNLHYNFPAVSKDVISFYKGLWKILEPTQVVKEEIPMAIFRNK